MRVVRVFLAALACSCYDAPLAEATAPASSSRKAAPSYADRLRQVVDIFQDAMVTRNASLGVSLFTASASWDIPLGDPAGHLTGQAAMLQDWSSFFGSLSTLKEQVVGEVVVNGNAAAYSKIEVDVRETDGCVSTIFGYNWMVFESEDQVSQGALPKITYYAFIFNSTAESAQCP
jgi:hypothetical protein